VGVKHFKCHNHTELIAKPGIMLWQYRTPIGRKSFTELLDYVRRESWINNRNNSRAHQPC